MFPSDDAVGKCIIRSQLPKQEEIFAHWPQEQNNKPKRLPTWIAYAKISSKVDITNVVLENEEQN